MVVTLSHVGLASGAPPGSEVSPNVGMACLLKAYPGQLCGQREDALIWCDGTIMAYRQWTDPRPHSLALRTADLHQQMRQRYPLGRLVAEPAVNFEPGRMRDERFFRKMYGGSAAEVRKKTTRIRWMNTGRKLRVTTVGGVHHKLRAVSRDLMKLEPRHRRIAAKTAGTFNWRTIRRSNRLSTHSFAIAIDVGMGRADYWRWRRPRKDGRLRYRNRIPHEIVEVFERHGFVWGGKWYHFDTMHFEYRPELLVEGCRTGEQ